MLKHAGRGDMLAKFLGGGLSGRPSNVAEELLPTGELGKAIINMQRGAPGNRTAAGLIQELLGRRVPPAHPWYQNVISNRGTMQASNAELKPFVKQMSLLKAAALMGMSRMIPTAAKALAKKAPVVARTASGGGPGLASQMRMAAKAQVRPPAGLSGGALRGGAGPITQPANIYKPMPLVSPRNPNSTFDASQLGIPQKMASIRATPIAKMIAGIAARHVQF